MLGLGIDTGGTYTDTVIMDLTTGKVITKAKALTTPHDLSVGVSNSLSSLGSFDPKQIKLVSISSTLATNSVVEGKGWRVGLIVAGIDYEPAIAVDEFIQIKGGHDINGLELDPLDLDKAREMIERVKDKVDAFAVSCYMSIRNPDHEKALKSLIRSICDRPVACGHEFSLMLGFYERTATVVLNAKLIPIIADLVQSIKSVISKIGIDAPLMIMKGDGSLMAECYAKERPVETVLSGPAASMIGARYLSGKKDGVVIDIGGTTTDIGVLKNGMPRLEDEGAMIGSFRTRVRAADITTVGLGGDSRIVIHNGEVKLTPLRVVPLCIASTKYPIVKTKLQGLSNKPMKANLKNQPVENMVQSWEFFIHSRDVPGFEMTKEESLIVEMVKKEPCSLDEISDRTGIHPYALRTNRLERLGIVSRIGLTPTDIMHAEGSYVQYDAEASRIGVSINAAQMKMEEEDFCRLIKKMVVDKITFELISKMLYDETTEMVSTKFERYLVEKLVKGEAGGCFITLPKLNVDIIGIGAPVREFLPQVAEKFQTGLVISEHADVGNAIGAITSNIVENVEVKIVPKHGVAMNENPPCTIHSTNLRMEFPTLVAAREYATEWARNEVMTRARDAGADVVDVLVDDHDDYSPLLGGHAQGILLNAKITAKAIGTPRTM